LHGTKVGRNGTLRSWEKRKKNVKTPFYLEEKKNGKGTSLSSGLVKAMGNHGLKDFLRLTLKPTSVRGDTWEKGKWRMREGRQDAGSADPEWKTRPLYFLCIVNHNVLRGTLKKEKPRRTASNLKGRTGVERNATRWVQVPHGRS